MEEGERTYKNGPPNPPLTLPVFAPLHVYVTLQYKEREMEQKYIHIGDGFKGDACYDVQTPRFKHHYIHYPKGIRIIEQKKYLDGEPQNMYPWHIFFSYFSFLKFFSIRYIMFYKHDKGDGNSEIEHKHANFWLGLQYSLPYMICTGI